MGTPEAPDLTGCIVRLGSEPIATGGYSSVWRGDLQCPAPNDPNRCLQVAIKVLRASHTDEHTAKRKLQKRLYAEIRVWTRLDHENVVTLLGHTQELEGPGLVSIWHPHGSVLNYLTNNSGANREVLCADIALGLQYLHEHEPRIIHGDLKGANVLIDSKGKASITDFGLSIILDGAPTGHTSSNFGGSLRFLAPELLDESSRTIHTDIYAYACTCIEILFDQEPYHQISNHGRLMRAIIGHVPPYIPPDEEVTFPLFLRLLQCCWQHDRSSRPPLRLIIDTIQRCLYRTHWENLTIHQGVGQRLRLMALPENEREGEATLSAVADDGLSIDIMYHSTSFCRFPIYQRYRWTWMNGSRLEHSKDLDASRSRDAHSDWPVLDTSSFLPGEGVPSSPSSPHVSEWKRYAAKFRLPYSSTVSYETYNEAPFKMPVYSPPPLKPPENNLSQPDPPSVYVSSPPTHSNFGSRLPTSTPLSSSSPRHAHPRLLPLPGAIDRSRNRTTHGMLPPLVIPPSPLSSAQEGLLSTTHITRPSQFYLPSPSSPNTREATPKTAAPPQHYPSRDQSLSWYLRPSWTTSDIIIDAHGQLKAGTARSLIEGLTMNESNVSQDVFLLTYPTFMSAESVVDLLAERYEMVEPRGLSQDEFEEWKAKKLWPVQTNVLKVISSWLMEYHMIELGSTVVDGVKQFLQLIRSHPKNETVAKRLLKTIDSMMDDRHSLPSPVSALSSPVKTKRSYLIWRRPPKVDFLTLNPSEVAQQLTLMEYRLYNEIRPSELLTWSSCQDQSNPKVKNLARFLHFNKCIAKFVALSIFSASESPRRSETIFHFLEVAETCRSLGNFSTVESTVAGIHAGFSPSPSEDLENMQLVEPRLEELRTLVSADSNYSGLRAAYQGLSGSCVPFIEMYLPLLVDVHQQFHDNVPVPVPVDSGGSHRSTLIINFMKRQRLAEVCKQALRFQGMPNSNLTHNPELAEILDDKLDFASSSPV